MKKNYFLLVILIVFFTACEKDQETGPEDTNTIIGGEIFSPTESSAEKSGDRLILTFTEETKTVQIVTNNNIEGTYSIISQSLKSASDLKANITYNDGVNSYNGNSGSLQIIENEGGTISGTYSATLISDNDVVIELSSGSFSEIQPLSTFTLITTETAIQDSLLACYEEFYNYIEFVYLLDAIYSNKVLAPNSLWNDIHGHTQTSANEKVLMLWSKSYDIIYKLNLILSSSGDAITDPSTRNTVDAQAKAIRAYIYHNLLIWFGEIPIESGFSDGMNPRNSIEEVLDQIKDDATGAVEYLPQSWSGSDNFRIPKSFVQGLFARVFLYDNSFDEALNVSQQIINSGLYDLSPATNNFTEGNVEIFWGFEKGNNTEFNDFFTKGLYVPVLRLTEIYLISIESSFNTGNTMEAISQINVLKMRGGEPDVMSIDVTDILQQWDTELELEGSTFITLKRFDSAMDELQIQGYQLVLPIPLVVLNNNPNLTQNPGY